MSFWGSNGNITSSSSSSSSSSYSSSNTTSTSTSSSSVNNGNYFGDPNNPIVQENRQLGPSEGSSLNLYSAVSTVSLMTKSLLPTRRRLKLDPSNYLYFPYEPGKQAKSAIGIKNVSKSNVAFKFQTTSPKSCYMRPPGAILAPGESLIATVFKFVEPPENNEDPLKDQKTKVKFKIMSLKVKGHTEFVPEMFDELKDQAAVEQILKVVFLDPECPTPALEKLKRQLAKAEAELDASKKPPEEVGPQAVGEGLVIDEWKERRESYLARQQFEFDSV